MKSHINDTIKRVNNPNKKTFLKRKNNSLLINSQYITFHKTNYIKNTKKIIKTRLNSTKEVKVGLKKSIISNFCLNNKPQASNEINIQTINPRPLINVITPPRQTKIKIIKKKEHQNQRNNEIISSLLNNKFQKETKNANSISTGLSNGTIDREGASKNFLDSDENNGRINVNNYNYNADSHSNKLETILFEEKTNNVNNFCYETISREDSNENENENRIILKCDNYSLLTFGNSFSYSNSHKRQTNTKFLNRDNDKINNERIKINLNKENDNIYINKLKEENEILKKELKESTEQISYLIHQIKDLKNNTFLPIKKNRKKSIHRNSSIKTNKTKEAYEEKIKSKLIRINKLNKTKNNKNHDILFNCKKIKVENSTNIHRKKKSREKFDECLIKIKI